MNATLRTLAVAATLAVGLGATSARAQGYAAPISPDYYYSAAGYYGTTAGTVYIPAPGYYYNVPANYAAPTISGYAPATTRPGWSYGDQPSPGYGVRRGGGGPNNPPY